MNRVFLKRRLHRPKTNEEKFWAEADKWLERMARRTERMAKQWTENPDYRLPDRFHVKEPVVTQPWKYFSVDTSYL